MLQFHSIVSRANELRTKMQEWQPARECHPKSILKKVIGANGGSQAYLKG
jgi:hypothetical protein